MRIQIVLTLHESTTLHDFTCTSQKLDSLRRSLRKHDAKKRACLNDSLQLPSPSLLTDCVALVTMDTSVSQFPNMKPGRITLEIMYEKSLPYAHNGSHQMYSLYGG